MKLLLVCSNGGHFYTMMGLKRFWSEHEREWVTHVSVDTEHLQNKEKVYWVEKQVARAYGKALLNVFKAIYILYKSKPQLIVSTGASIAVPFLVAGKLLGIKTVFIESISRSSDLSLSGKLVYNLVDKLYVQWEECIKKYPKAEYQGIVE